METFCSDCFCFRGRDDEMTSGSRPQVWASIHWRNKSKTPRQVFRSHAMQTLVRQSAQFVTDPLRKPRPVQIFPHNFSYARIARQLHNEASSCTQDRLEITVDVHRLIWKYTVTVIQSTVNHGSHKSMRSFLAQGVTNKTELTEVKITVPYCGVNMCGHGQVTVNDNTQISDVLRRSDPCPCNLKRTHRAVPQPSLRHWLIWSATLCENFIIFTKAQND